MEVLVQMLANVNLIFLCYGFLRNMYNRLRPFEIKTFDFVLEELQKIEFFCTEWVFLLHINFGIGLFMDQPYSYK